MNLVSDIAQVRQAMQKAKKEGAPFHTNFFPDASRIGGWIQHRDLLGEYSDGLALFLRQDRGFFHLYFCAVDLTALQNAVTLLRNTRGERLAVDLVGAADELGPLLNLFEAAGFRRYTRLCRMVKSVPQGVAATEPASRGIGYAEPTDSPAVFELLSRSFDPYAEQLPTEYEITAAIQERQLLVAKPNGTLAGLLFFETRGLTSTIRYWLIAEGFREQGLGARLMRSFLAMHNSVRRFVLWIIENNHKAAAKYVHYGFARERLIDQVLLS